MKTVMRLEKGTVPTMRWSSAMRTMRRFGLPLVLVGFWLAGCTTTTPVQPPQIGSFAADPAAIVVGASSTLSWQVSGATSIVVTDDQDVVVVDGASATGSQVVSPIETTEYTLTATGPGGTSTSEVTVTVTSVTAPDITSFTAAVVLGSQVQLSWSATGAASYDVLAVLDGDSSDTVVLAAGLSGTGTTVAIPASDRQLLRLVAMGPVDPADTAELVLQNVVTSSGDYDPYDLQGITPEPEVTGTLRSVLANAPSGSIVGFASDISTVTLYGVDVEDIGASAVVDAHLILRADVALSGPASRVTIQGVSGWSPGDPGDAFTYQSRMLFVSAGIDVTLENLVLTGGTFIFNGGAIRNHGNLIVASSVITGNRAWQRGGAIFNFDGAVLDIVDSEITNNRAVTENDEVGVSFAIRGGFEIAPLGADGFGGAIFNNPGGTVTVTNSLIANNEARISGGGIYNSGGTMTLVETDVTGNEADYNVYDAVAPALFSYGGGIYNNGAFSFANGALSNGVAASQGGGLYHDANATSTLTGVQITNNLAGTAGEAGFGGGILHRYYTGEAANLALSGVTYATNVPQNIFLSDIGVRPLGVSALDAEPRPGVFRLPAGVERGDRDW